MIFDDRFEILNVFMHNNTARSIQYKKKEDYIGLSKSTNIVIAAYTTSYARLRLYKGLECLQEKVLYMDTDSIIFTDKGEPVPIKCGPMLGDFTSELEEDDYIVEFVSTGPKSYAYVTNKGKCEVKCKGFSLNYEASQVIHFDGMKRMLEDKSSVMVQPLTFEIGKDHCISTKLWDQDCGKVFKETFSKRKKVGDLSTPF